MGAISVREPAVSIITVPLRICVQAARRVVGAMRVHAWASATGWPGSITELPDHRDFYHDSLITNILIRNLTLLFTLARLSGFISGLFKGFRF